MCFMNARPMPPSYGRNAHSKEEQERNLRALNACRRALQPQRDAARAEAAAKRDAWERTRHRSSAEDAPAPRHLRRHLTRTPWLSDLPYNLQLEPAREDIEIHELIAMSSRRRPRGWQVQDGELLAREEPMDLSAQCDASMALDAEMLK